MNSRKQARQVIAQLIQANIPQLQAVYPSPPASYDTLSPFAVIESAGTRPSPTRTFANAERQQLIAVSLFWALAPTAEDGLDDLSEQVINLFDANGNATVNWSGLMLDEPFTLIGEIGENKIGYRIEVLRVIIW